MGKLKDAILVLGEGSTEFYYFNSIRDVFKSVTFRPEYPKHTSIGELDRKIKDGIGLGYSKIFCVIDMDNKETESECKKYLALRARYKRPISKPKKGIYCEVKFFETHPCTELFFLYYFRYTARHYFNQEELLKDLNRNIAYVKSGEFFGKSGGLHGYFERNGGSLAKAVLNAKLSMKEKQDGIRDYTYSELGGLIEELTACSVCGKSN